MKGEKKRRVRELTLLFFLRSAVSVLDGLSGGERGRERALQVPMLTVFSHLRKNIAVVRSESVITAKFTHSHTHLSSLSPSDTHILVYTITFRGLGLYHFYIGLAFSFLPSLCWEYFTFAEGVKLTQTERLSLSYLFPLSFFFSHLLYCSGLFI